MKTGIVDTHILVWYLEGKKNLKNAITLFLDDENNRLVIPTIVLCELKYLIEKKRLTLGYEKIFDLMMRDPRVEICPLDLDVVKQLSAEFDIHDGIIVASYCKTAAENESGQTYLLTQDKTICRSKMVQILH